MRSVMRVYASRHQSALVERSLVFSVSCEPSESLVPLWYEIEEFAQGSAECVTVTASQSSDHGPLERS
jgi:hypothetical protein